MAAGTKHRANRLVAGVTLLCLCLAAAPELPCQSNRYRLTLLRSEPGKKSRTLHLTFQDSSQAKTWIDNLSRDLWQQGYLSVDVRREKQSSDSARVTLMPGNQVRLYSLTRAGETRRRKGTLPAFNEKEIMPLLRKAENHGHPFARIAVDSVLWSGGMPHFFLSLEPGPLIILDTMDVAGSAKVSRRFLEAYLGMKPGSPYREKAISGASNRLERLPYAAVTEGPSVLFKDSLAQVKVRLSRKPCSTVYGFLGLAPASSFNPRLLLMGEARLHLHHALGFGESIDLEWRRLQVQTQSLRFGLAWPYLLNTQLGAEGLFDFYRKDSSFQNIQLSLGLRYLFPGQNHIRFGFQRFISRLIDRKNLASLAQLPPAHDATMNLAFCGTWWENTDNRFSPARGFIFQADAAAGIRKMPRLPGISDSLYRGIPLQAPFWQAMVRGEQFLPMGRMWVLRVSESGGYMGSSTLFQNQLFRLGGLRHLRGFNEESLFASSYLTCIVEPRLRFERNSFVCVFANGGYLQRHTSAGWIEDLPLGFGAGGAIDTKAGQLELYYAYGMLRQQPLRLREAKIHIGYRVIF